MAIGDSQNNRDALQQVKASIPQRVPVFGRAYNTLYGREQRTVKQRDAALHDLLKIFDMPETTEERRYDIAEVFLDAEDAKDLRPEVKQHMKETCASNGWSIRDYMNHMLEFELAEAKKHLGKTTTA